MPGLKSGVLESDTDGFTAGFAAEGLVEGFDGVDGRDTVVLGLRSDESPEFPALTAVFLDGLETVVRVPVPDPPGRVWVEGLAVVCLEGVDFFTFELLPAWREVLVAVRDSFLPV